MERKYVQLSSWLAVRNFLGPEAAGLRPPDVSDLQPKASLPPTSTRVLVVTSLRPDPEIAAQARSARVDAMLGRLGIQPRRRR